MRMTMRLNGSWRMVWKESWYSLGHVLAMLSQIQIQVHVTRTWRNCAAKNKPARERSLFGVLFWRAWALDISIIIRTILYCLCVLYMRKYTIHHINMIVVLHRKRDQELTITTKGDVNEAAGGGRGKWGASAECLSECARYAKMIKNEHVWFHDLQIYKMFFGHQWRDSIVLENQFINCTPVLFDDWLSAPRWNADELVKYKHMSQSKWVVVDVCWVWIFLSSHNHVSKLSMDCKGNHLPTEWLLENMGFHSFHFLDSPCILHGSSTPNMRLGKWHVYKHYSPGGFGLSAALGCHPCCGHHDQCSGENAKRETVEQRDVLFDGFNFCF